ncbi:MAG: phosphodiester glycosidase family protein [Deltaproteobacteria bacterium]|nr:phosphodiester glycosidase family protein [Deltaproteobacteria bacterium]
MFGTPAFFVYNFCVIAAGILAFFAVLLYRFEISYATVRASSFISGVSYHRYGFPPKRAFLAKINISNHKDNLRVVDAKRLKRESVNVMSFVSSHAVEACVNGSFYTETNEPIGLLVSRGKIINPVHSSKGTLRSILSSTLSSGLVVQDIHSNVPHDTLEAIQGGTTFASVEKFLKTVSYVSAAKSLVCLKTDRDFELISFSALFEDSRKLKPFISEDCSKLVTLDGGSSSSLWFKVKRTSANVSGVNQNAYVPVMLCILPAEELGDKLQK